MELIVSLATKLDFLFFFDLDNLLEPLVSSFEFEYFIFLSSC